MVPSTREEFKLVCLQNLGHPVIEINVDDDQVENRVDYALKQFADYHFDGTETQYYKHIITANNYPDRVYDVTVNSGGTGYTNGTYLTFTSARGSGANASVTTNANGTITSVALANNGDGYDSAPTITVSGGTGANVTCELGGFVPMPDNIIGVVKIFDLTNTLGSIANPFSVQYQILANEIWSLSSTSMVPYYTMMMHLNLIQQLLVGSVPIRYTRHRNRVNVDMSWDRVEIGQFLLFECYQVIDPAVYSDVWGDKWLQKYATALIKLQWGNNLKKFSGMMLPSGIQFNGQQIYDEAKDEVTTLEETMINDFSIPHGMFIG